MYQPNDTVYPYVVTLGGLLEEFGIIFLGLQEILPNLSLVVLRIQLPETCS